MGYSYRQWVFVALVAGSSSLALAADPREKSAFVDAAAAGPDFAVQGEYEGMIGTATKVGAQVIARGDGKFAAVIYDMGLPGAGWTGQQGKEGNSRVELTGATKEGVTNFEGKNFKGTIRDGVFRGTAEANVAFEMKKIERRSPTLGAEPPQGATVLFDGKKTDAWQEGKIEEGNLLGVPARTKAGFQDFTLHIEFRTPFMPFAGGQERANSGVYLLDQYECQVLDSFGLKGEDNECGAIYKQAKPKVNMCLPPLSWQTYDVEFTAARFDAAGKKMTDAIITIRHNGVVIHENFKPAAATPGGGRMDERPGPLFLQNHGDPVRYRNIWIVEKK